MDSTTTNLTFGDLFERWANSRLSEWAPSTQRTYLSMAPRILEHLGHLLLVELGPADLDEFYNCLRVGRGPDGAQVRPLAASSTQRYHGLIGAALSQAERWDLIIRNPARRASPPTARSSISAPSTDEVVRALRRAQVMRPKLGVFLRLAITTGARRGELSALRWSHIDMDRALMQISQAISMSPSGERVVKAPKSGRTRTVALDPTTVDILARHRRLQRELAERRKVELDPNPYVFTNSSRGHRPWNPETATAGWIRLRSQIGLDHVRLHDLRHYAITTMLAGGIPVRTVSDRVGHSNAAMTLNVYGHALPAQDREAAALLAATI